MRIAVVQPKLTWAGGIEVFLSSVLSRLSRENEVAIFSFQFDPAALPERSGFEVRVVGGRTDVGGHFKAFLGSRRQESLLSALKSWKPDAVIVQQHNGIRLSRWLNSQLNGVPVIPYIHDAWTVRMIGDFRTREEASSRAPLKSAIQGIASASNYESGSLKEGTTVACVSEFIKGRASRLWPDADLRVIHNGVDHKYFSPTGEDDGYALCVSRVDRAKNLDLIFENFKDAPYPVIVCASVLKGNRSSEEYARELLSKANGPIKLMLDQDHSTVRNLMQKSSLLVQPGKDEGFGLVPLEAMACGKPVLAHRSGGTIEVIDQGGILLGDDGKEWRLTADRLMADSSARNELGRKALENSNQFDWDKTAAEIVALCKEAQERKLQGSGRGGPGRSLLDQVVARGGRPVRPVARGHPRFAFIFSTRVAYPPNIHDMKCFYLTRELMARGGRVAWIVLGSSEKRHMTDGIDFEGISTSTSGNLATNISIARAVLYCLSRRVKVVYLDDWLFFRNRPWRFMAGVIGIRLVGIKVVMDERDPLVDFRVASGDLSPRSRGYQKIRRARVLSERLASLVLLTSKAYERTYVAEGFPPGKVFGSFRGIDTSLFNPDVDPNSVREGLNLHGKFVIGWFGLMHPFRMIKEVLIPMIREVSHYIPDAHVLIGGQGPLLNEFQKLSEEKGLPVTMLGLVSYADLPKYIAACQVLLCPVSSGFRFTQNSAWLKIPEALAVGRPVIATRTNISELDYKSMKGAVWVDPTLDGFMGAIESLHEDYQSYLSDAQEQAHDFDEYAIPHTVGKIVDRIEALAIRPN